MLMHNSFYDDIDDVVDRLEDDDDDDDDVRDDDGVVDGAMGAYLHTANVAHSGGPSQNHHQEHQPTPALSFSRYISRNPAMFVPYYSHFGGADFDDE